MLKKLNAQRLSVEYSVLTLCIYNHGRWLSTDGRVQHAPVRLRASITPQCSVLANGGRLKLPIGQIFGVSEVT